MFNVFGDVLSRLYVAQHKIVSIDNTVMKLHYRVTFWLLLGCTTLVCSRQYFGDHIRCIADKGVEGHVVNTFCFFTATYTLQSNHSKENYAHPGVSNHVEGEKKIVHSYYQWVPFVLFGQALLFYLPHLIWKNFEGGTIRALTEGLQRLYMRAPDDNDYRVQNFNIYSKKSMSKTVADLNAHFKTIIHFRLNRYWAVMLVFCEMLNLVNAIFQMYLLDAFLGGNFWSLGRKLWRADPFDNPFDIVFPKVAKCDFQKYGPTGQIQTFDVMCVMALNIINEKIYSILWFWFAVLIPISVGAIAWRIVCYVLHSRSESFNHYLLRETTGHKQNAVDVAIITRQSCFADWLLLYYLGSNVDAVIFEELLHSLANDLDEHRHSPDFEDEKKPLKAA